MNQATHVAIRRDIDNICCIYPTAGEAMYEEVRQRLTGRICSTIETLGSGSENLELMAAWAHHCGLDVRDERVRNGWPDDFRLFAAGWNARHTTGEQTCNQSTQSSC